MADTYTSSLRFTQPQTGASTNWPTLLNTDMSLIDSAIAGRSTVNINGLTTYSLTSNNGAADQARQPVYIFTGTLAANCTVTIPAVSKQGWVINNTTGGYDVVLTTGGGTTVSVSGDLTGYWTLFECDGTNLTFPSVSAPNGFSVTGITLEEIPTAGGFFNIFSVTGTGIVGSIQSSGSGTLFNTTSDYRLKETLGAFLGGDTIDAVRVYEGYYKATPEHRRAMFLAHEVAEMAPWAVTGAKDAVDADGGIQPQMLDHSALVPVLWAAVRDLRKRVAALEHGFVTGAGR